jgi:arsenate reductase
MKLYHNPRCRKSREGLCVLEEAGQDVEVVEYMKNPPSKAEMKDILKKLGINAEQLVRKGEKIFKEEFKEKSLTESQWIDAMIKYPNLIQRPILIKGDKAALGRPVEDIIALMNS